MQPPQTEARPAPKVLLLTASVGAGHNAAARAIQAGLARRAPELPVELLDVLSLTSRWFRALYAGGYAFLVSHLPSLYGLGYRLTDLRKAPRRSLMERRRLRSERRALDGLAERLVDMQPDVIVHTHFLAPPVVGRLIRAGRLRSRQMVAITDTDAHRYWFAESVDRWFASSPHCAARLRTWGIEPDRVTLSGIPIHPKWSDPLDRGKILADWGLPADRPIVLLSGGTEFTCGPVTKIARDLLTGCPDAVVVVLAGNNKDLAARLARIAAAEPRLRIVSFTDRVHELVEAASVMVTKAGGITTAECLHKATPMVLLKPVPGQERANAEYFRGEGAARIARRRGEVVEQVARLLGDRAALDAMADSARGTARDGTPDVVEAVLAALTGGAATGEAPAGPGP